MGYMTTAQTLYAVTFSVYLIFFVLFARFFVWKWYSETRYWNRRPSLTIPYLIELSAQLRKQVPFISILVPARNESLVIENTIKHMARLNYPVDRYEIVVITDEKEISSVERERRKIAQKIGSLLKSDRRTRGFCGNDETSYDKTRIALISCLSGLALKEYASRNIQRACSLGVNELLMLPAAQRHRLVRDICVAIIESGGAPSRNLLAAIIKRTCPWLSDLDVVRLYPASLAAAVPVIAAYSSVSGDTNRRLLKNTVRHTLKANHALTQEIISRMTDLIAGRVLQGVYRLAETGHLDREVWSALSDCYPSTQEVVERTVKELSSGSFPRVKHVCVPIDFDGKLGGQNTGKPVPSTKGRALNYGIAFVDPRAEVCGFFDAESRPHADVLLYVGYRRLLDPSGSKVLQGPVFQVRNFYRMTPFCRIAALYQCIAHDWYLPWLFRTLPFVGGTNVFVELDLLRQVGGWDCHVLTEDLEFGARAYLLCDAWPEYLPYSSTEQTPATFKAFFRQRLRWGTGHLQVVEKVAADKNADREKRRKLLGNLILKGQVEWIAYQIATFVPPIAMILHYRNLLDPTVIPPAGHWLLSSFSVIYASFTVYALKRYSPYLDKTCKPSTLVGNAAVYLGLLLLPLAAFVFPVPYTSALILKTIGREPRVWVKTPRTEEPRIAG